VAISIPNQLHMHLLRQEMNLRERLGIDPEERERLTS
jgi:hypothetical protein